MRKIKYLKKEDIYAEKFIKLPKKVFYNEKLTPNCKIIYAEILNLYSLSLNGDKGKRWRDSGGNYYCICDRDILAKNLKLSLKTIHKSIKILEKEELIEIKSRGLGKKSKIYLRNFKGDDFKKSEDNLEKSLEKREDCSREETSLDIGKNFLSEGKKVPIKGVKSSQHISYKTNSYKTKYYKTKRNTKKTPSLCYKLASILYKNILKNDSHFKEPRLNYWAMDLKPLVFEQKRSFEEIKQVIDFATDDDFWSGNIVNARKLTKNYTTIFIQMKNQMKNPNKTRSKAINCGINIYDKDKEKYKETENIIDVSSLNLREEIEKLGLDR